MWPAVALKEVGGRAGKEQNGMGVSGRCKRSGMREEKKGERGEGGGGGGVLGLLEEGVVGEEQA